MRRAGPGRVAARNLTSQGWWTGKHRVERNSLVARCDEGRDFSARNRPCLRELSPASAPPRHVALQWAGRALYLWHAGRFGGIPEDVDREAQRVGEEYFSHVRWRSGGKFCPSQLNPGHSPR